MEAIKNFFDKKKKEENLKNVNKLTLKERKQIVKNSLKKIDINLDEFKYLLLLDNTNEELIFRFIKSLDEDSIYFIMQKYMSYLSLSKISDLHKQYYRNISNKSAFFKLISSINENNQVLMDNTISIIKKNGEKVELNNQPFDLENFEAFYYHLCDLF